MAPRFQLDQNVVSLNSIRFDTIKVRLQTTEKARFKGPLDCLLQTTRHEGVRGLYKGATPPLVGWMFMDSVYGAFVHELPQRGTKLSDLACLGP